MLKKNTIIDLTHTIHAKIPTWDRSCGYQVTTMLDYDDCHGEFKFRSQSLTMQAGIGTHIDAPAHCVSGARDVSDLTVDELIRPCVVIDVSQKAHERYNISEDDIHAFEEQYGTIQAGTFVLFYTGWSRFWDEPARYHNNLVYPSVDAQVARMLIERDVAGIGIDTLSPDRGAEGLYPVHALLLSADKYIVENVAHAYHMPPTGSSIVIMPLKLKGATESPVRLLGIIS